ncbi:LysR family transcriptional regulator [Gordonia jinghuaiqii]|uniref:LysR family transcriptional regulator n=1 Tax=Gordonia jinghuaiqii TaxID=2758710 RepID=A0A7D7LRG3_9ACTN|nr:LysR family transcriptional regulator [Gordonia jinghuaiqii]MCR5976563.1 LysR family transcriptional regulator [Gordonia jinghuaiqii]QMS99756.1 LysR family transcriptional regulator [Gordonia jinghuaiqii]
MLDVSLRELEYVVAVHRERNFTRAAQQLHMAQPALSQAILRLERRLGVRLFDRTSRRVEPTVAGHNLAVDALDIIDRVGAAIVRTTATPRRAVTVHISEPALETPRRLMAALRSADPALSMHLTTLPRSLTGDDARGAQLSLTIGAPIQVAGARSTPLRAERVGALMDVRHPLAPQVSVTGDDLERYPVVSIDDQLSQWNRWIAQWATSQGRPPRWTTSAVFGIVASSDMVTDGESLFVCLESVAADVSDNFRWLPLAPTVTASWFLNWMDAHSDSPEVRDCVSAAAAFAEECGWITGGSLPGR